MGVGMVLFGVGASEQMRNGWGDGSDFGFDTGVNLLDLDTP